MLDNIVPEPIDIGLFKGVLDMIAAVDFTDGMFFDIFLLSIITI